MSVRMIMYMKANTYIQRGHENWNFVRERSENKSSAYKRRKFERPANEGGMGPESWLVLKFLHHKYQPLRLYTQTALNQRLKQR